MGSSKPNEESLSGRTESLSQAQSFTKWGPMTLLGPALRIDVVKLLEICANGKEDQPRGSQAWWEPELLKTGFA